MFSSIGFVFVVTISSCFTLQLNIYTSIGQVRQEITLKDGFYQAYFTSHEYNDIVPGTIDFPGQRMIEQDFYGSNELLRNAEIFIRSNDCSNNARTKAKLVDPYSFLVENDVSRYTYVARDRLEFTRDPTMDGMVLSVRLEDSTVKKANMTYLTRGLWWTPRYEVLVVNDQTATLRALADINNEHERSYEILNSQLITGGVPLVSGPSRAPSIADAQRFEYMASPMLENGAAISAKPEATNFGSYTYNVTRQYHLWPKSIKTFPFLSTNISLNYTLEASTYLSTGTNSGLFQRNFMIQPADFLPAGTVTFYLASTSITLGQGRLPDTPPKSEQKISLGNDPDVKYNIISVITATRQTPTYAQDLNVNITLTNRKDKQTVNVVLMINSGYRNTTLTVRNRSSSSITIIQDPINRSIMIVRATIKPNQEETCMCVVKQSN